MDVQKPEGGSPTHTLPSLSVGDNETDRGSTRKKIGWSFIYPLEKIHIKRTCQTQKVISECQ